MADDTLLPDAVADRNQEWFARLGISGSDYSIVTQQAIARALADPADASPSPWAPFGARNIGGRIRSLGQDPQQPDVIYAGSAQGGVFKTDNGGDTWAPLGAPQDAFPVGALAVDQRNSAIVYVGSGQTLMDHTVVPAAPPNPAFIQGSSWEAGGVGFLRCDQSVLPPAFVTEVGPYSTVGPLPGAADQYARVVCDPATEGRCWIASDTGLWRRELGQAPNPPLPPTFVLEAVPPGAAAMPALPAPPARPAPNRAFGVNCCDVLVTPNPDPAQP
ncbi:MAG: WD40/YVTN/BNR-like repeat-containing protein, partial [Leptothrix sp. (in: b-proteobacteria)]